jgi:hypothetical protein
MIKKLFLTVVLLAPSLAYGDASTPLSVRITPASATCQLGNHGAVRGWAHVAAGTMVADDGCLLQISYPSAAPFDSAGTLSEWQDVANNGHYNTVRYSVYLGCWYDDSCGGAGGGQTIQSIETQLDDAVSLAQQTGMYVLVDNHTTLPDNTGNNWGCPDWNADVTFWTAIAPRYANKANVIYQIQNEPDWCGHENYTDIAQHEDSLYQLIRSYAPRTPIFAWSFLNPNWVFGASGGLLGTLALAPHIDYSNATVDFHDYSGGDTTFISTARGAGDPVTMSEYGPCAGGAWNAVLSTMQSQGVSWNCGDGYPDNNPGFVVTWPKD